MNTFKKLLVSTSAASLLIVGIASVGAQDTTEDGKGQRGFGQRGENIALIEEYTGLSGAALREAIQDGATLAELIEENGESVEAFVDEATENAEARINQAVESGRLTEEEGAERLAEVEARVTARVNGTFEPGDRRRGLHGDGERPRGPRGGGNAPDAPVTEGEGA